MTGKIALEGHPQEQTYKLIRWFRESIKSQCDLAYFTSELAQEYPDLDITEFADKLWFLKDAYVPLENPEVDHRKIMIEEYEKNPSEETLVKYMERVSPVRVETNEQAYLRIENAKNALREYMRELEASGNEIKDFELVVTAHSNVLKYFTADSVDEKFKPVGFHYFQNAEVLEFEIDY